MPTLPKTPDNNVKFFWNMANAANASKSAGSDQKKLQGEVPQWKQKARDHLAAARQNRLADKKRLPEETNTIIDKAINDDAAAVVDLVTKAISARAKEMVQAKYNPAPEADHPEETEQ